MKKVLVIILCMVMAISGTNFIFFAETGESVNSGAVTAAEETLANAEGQAGNEAEGTVGSESLEEPGTGEGTERPEQPGEELETPVENENPEEFQEPIESETPGETQDPVENENPSEVQEPAESGEQGDGSESNDKEDSQAIQELTYENDEVHIVVSALTEGAIPEGSSLQVIPIVKEDSETASQYQDVEKKLLEKAESEEYDIAGFLAYDICFVDAEGNKLEPSGEVKVAMDYKQAVIPEVEAETAETDVTVMHLEEDAQGQVARVVDMAKEGKVTALDTTQNQEVQKTEFVTESFSTFVITWTTSDWWWGSHESKVTVHYVDEDYREIQGSQTNNITGNTNGNAISLAGYAEAINGYTFERIETSDKRQISKLRYNNGYVQFDNGYWENGIWSLLSSTGNSTSAAEKWNDWFSAGRNGEVYIVYKKNSSASATLGEPAHAKYIKYNQKSKNYTLTLNVTGRKGKAATGIDVLFVIDKSGSMGTGYYNLLPDLKQTLRKDIIPAILPAGSSNRMSLVSFSQTAAVDVGWVGHSKEQEIKDAVNSLAANGGTNWQSAMYRANEALSSAASSRNQKVVVFVSDGQPTFQGTANGTGDGSNYREDYFTAAVKQVVNSQYLKDAKIYSVYLTNETATTMKNFANYLKSYGVDAESVDGASNMKKALTDLTATIVPAYKNVTIEDTLSTYVDFADEQNPLFTVIRTMGEDEVPLKEGTDYEIVEKDKKIKLILKGDEKGELAAGATYSISFDVKLSEEAEKYYKEHKAYPAVDGKTTKGDADTDAPDNVVITSSGKEGFYSNDGATISYQENDNPLQTAVYKKPVVQIPSQNDQEIIKSSLESDKTAKVRDWKKRTYDINITAKSKVVEKIENEEKTAANIMLVVDASGSMNYPSASTSTSTDTSYANFKEVGAFSTVESTLDRNKLYYYTNKTQYGSGTRKYYASQPMVYVDNAWQYYDGSKWTAIGENNRTIIYEYPSRLTSFKEAAMEFLKTLAKASPGSMVGISTFNSDGKLVSGLVPVGENLSTLIKSINGIYADGGTYMDKGLGIANTQLNGPSDNTEYVILFCDGAASDQSVAKTTAATMKGREITIYTIGIGLNDTNKAWLSNNIASDADHALTSANASQLSILFGTISSEITNVVPITGATIKDVIDPRFVILDANGNPITEETPGIGQGISVQGGKVYYENGTQYIVWENVTIPTDTWSETITVQAKPDYIGGNNVTTNISPDSAISTEYGDAVLPQPTVNVKPGFDIKDYEVTIFKGDFVPATEEIQKELFDKNGWKDVNANGEYAPLEEGRLTLGWYEDSSCQTSTDLGKMGHEKPHETKKYYLKATCSFGKPTEESNANTTLKNEVYTAGNAKGSESGYVAEEVGVYTVNVVSGQIQITKVLAAKDTTNKAFSFTITKKNEGGNTDTSFNANGFANGLKTVTITVPANQMNATMESADVSELSSLPRGIYEVKENVTRGYMVQGIDCTEADCHVEGNSDTTVEDAITFTLGLDTTGKDVIDNYKHIGGGQHAKVTFTNTKAQWKMVKRSSSSATHYLQGAKFNLMDSNKTVLATGVSGENGVIAWTWENGVNIKDGTYTVVETEAPKGYVCNTAGWDVTFKNGMPESYTDNSNETVPDKIEEDADGAPVVYLANKVLYELPEQGGNGIYGYMISSMLFMLGGVLVFYKTKFRKLQ